jgi:hypothetical protein
MWFTNDNNNQLLLQWSNILFDKWDLWILITLSGFHCSSTKFTKPIIFLVKKERFFQSFVKPSELNRLSKLNWNCQLSKSCSCFPESIIQIEVLFLNSSETNIVYLFSHFASKQLKKLLNFSKVLKNSFVFGIIETYRGGDKGRRGIK